MSEGAAVSVTLPSRLLSLECTSNWMSIVCRQSWYMGTKASAHSVPHAFGSECPSHDCGLGQQALDMACGINGDGRSPNGEQRMGGGAREFTLRNWRRFGEMIRCLPAAIASVLLFSGVERSRGAAAYAAAKEGIVKASRACRRVANEAKEQLASGEANCASTPESAAAERRHACSSLA